MTMMTIGPFLFATPGAFLLLLTLPLLWWLLRATPPPPKQAELPSLRLLDDIHPPEETPSRTPWWLWLLRTLAILTAITGLSQPVYAPGTRTVSERGGPFLIVIDNGWMAAPRWSETINAAIAAMDTHSGSGSLHLLLTAPGDTNPDPGEGMVRAEMTGKLSGLAPMPWPTNREEALTRLKAADLKPSRIFYASDGLETAGGSTFADTLAGLAPLTIYSAPPRGAAAITGLSVENDRATVRLARLDNIGETQVSLTAFAENGISLATTSARFSAGENIIEVPFVLPAAVMSRISGFRITGLAGAGSVWMWDSLERSRHVGLVDTGTAAQPLLSDMHYVRRAIEPFATISTGDIAALASASPDAIILSDIGQIPAGDTEILTAWLEAGGTLIRFAGPRLAAQGDDLLPVALRRASRAMGGALAWEEPQAIASFPETSPFAGLDVPQNVRIRQQVLATPDPQLARRTWASLSDGSPLITAQRRGQGTLVLFHVTAGPDWADLAYSGAFSQLLRRAIAAGRGETIEDATGTYLPETMLDGFGQLKSPPSSATPLRSTDLDTAEPSPSNPPGLYRGPAGTRALNAGSGADLELITRWPASAELVGDAQSRSRRLAGPLLTIAGLILSVDILITLLMTGRLRLPGLARQAPAIAGTILPLAMLLLSPEEAWAQTGYGLQSDRSYRPAPFRAADTVPLPGSQVNTKQAEAALNMRFGFVQTGDAGLNERTRAGLRGLSLILSTRTSVEPAEPHALDLENDALELYPLIYFNVPDTQSQLSALAIQRLNTYLRAGGALLVDTRQGASPDTRSDVSGLEKLLSGLDAPAMQPVPPNHVLSRSFYLIEDYPGRFAGRRLWIERSAGPGIDHGDGVSRLFVGDADWASAWASDEYGRDLYSVDGGFRQREAARRFGVNLVMYILTGSYKDDQVHVPALLERLGKQDNMPDEMKLPDLRPDGGRQ